MNHKVTSPDFYSQIEAGCSSEEKTLPVCSGFGAATLSIAPNLTADLHFLLLNSCLFAAVCLSVWDAQAVHVCSRKWVLLMH